MAPMFRSPVSPTEYKQNIRQQTDLTNWNGVDADSVYSLKNSNNRTLRSSGGSSRRYVDPWDLENYVYIKRNMESSPEPSITTPSPAGEPISSTFYYVPGRVDNNINNRGCYAGLDEKTFCNEKLNMFSNDGFEEDAAYSTYTDIETERSETSGDQNSSCGSSVSTLHLHTPGFRVASGQRIMVLPKPPPNLEFPPPPPPQSSYDYYELPVENNYCSLNDCYECISNVNMPLYDTLRQKKHHNNTMTLNPPNHFGLSKKGLLQIDYSCNWNNLDRYIAK